jgi:hypothetical protein
MKAKNDATEKTNKYNEIPKSISKRKEETGNKALEYLEQLGKRTFREGKEDWKKIEAELEKELKNAFPKPQSKTKERLDYIKQDDKLSNIVYKALEIKSTPFGRPIAKNKK